MTPARPRQAAALFDGERLRDVLVTFPDGRTLRLGGRDGAGRERLLGERLAGEEALPVFVGAGLGAGLAACLAARPGRPVAVVDREADIQALTGSKALALAHPEVLWCDQDDPAEAARAVTGLRRRAGLARLAVVVSPAYARLDPEYYGQVRRALDDHSRFLARAVVPRFAAAPPRVLLFDSPYFLTREIGEALSRLGATTARLATPLAGRGDADFVERLLELAVSFRPDMCLTVNHLGLDRQGVLAGLLADLRLPLASWFVDSPRLILHEYEGLAGPWSMVFTWDRDSLGELRAMGFEHALWLPLATDPERFAPPVGSLPAGHPWRARASFVGASMVGEAARPLERLRRRLADLGRPGEEGRPDGADGADRAALAFFLRELPALAEGFAAAPERSVPAWLAAGRPEAAAWLAGLSRPEDRLDVEQAVTWRATLSYRLACVRGLVDLSPLIVGDAGWETLLPGQGTRWRRLGPIGYYQDLPRFYGLSGINLNCTSRQMKGAVNQRVFDAPASGGFVLTDAQAQMAELFEPGRESASYADPGEIPGLARYFLDHPDERGRIVRAARARIVAEHAYTHRVTTLLAAMGRVYGPARGPG